VEVLKTNSGRRILKVILLALIFATWAFVSIGCTSAEESEMGWTKTFAKPGWDVGKWVQQTADCGYILAGEPLWYGPVSFDVSPVKTDFNGNEYLKPDWTRDVIPKITNSIIIRSAELSIEAANDTVVYGVDMVLTVQGVLNCWYYVVVTNVTVSRPPEIKLLGDVKALSGDAVISADAPNLAAWIKTGSDGIADVKVSTTAADKRTYMIKVYETPEDALGPLLTPDDPGGPTWACDLDIVVYEDDDAANVTVVPPTVAFNVPAKVIVGEKVNIEGAIPVGQKVDVVIRDTEVVATDERVDEYKEFSVEWDTSEYLIGSYIIEGYIDFMVGMPKDLSSYEGVDPDGNATIRIIPPGLDATQPRDVVAEGDGYYFEGTATGVNAVDYVLVGPKGWKTGHAANVLGGIVKGAASVNDSEFSEDETMTEGLDLGVWVAVVLHPGRDGTYHKTGEGGGSLTLAALGVTDGKTQTQILEIVEDAITMAGSDDLMVILAFKVDSAQEIRFTGTVTDKNPPGQVGALWWNVTAEAIISGPQTSCDTLRVDLILSPPLGYYESNIDVGNRVEVYGNYISNFCTVSLNGESYYIVVLPSVHNLNTSEDFATIQAAIDDVDTVDGHTILVDSGTYHERVNVTKQLILRGNDTGGGKPVVDAGGNGNAIALNADGITVDSFTVINAKSFLPQQAGIFVFSNNNIVINNTVSNNDFGIYLESSSNNNLTGNIASKNSDGIDLIYASNNTLTGNTANLNNGAGIHLGSSSNNTLTGNIANSNNYDGIYLYASSNNTLTNNSANSNTFNGIYLDSSGNNNLMDNTVSNNNYGIRLQYSSSNNIYNNHFNNTFYNALDDGTNIWNITKTGGTNIIGGPYLGGNYWRDYDGNDTNGDGLGDTPYDIYGGANKDYLPLVAIAAPEIFDTGEGDYPSISGTHNGTIKLNQTITVSKLYTYPCPGTGGHIKYAKIWNSSWSGAEARWNGYVDDWHNCSFDNNFTLVAGETCNYTIITGSYPQVHHTAELLTAKGWITCSEFIDINGKRHVGWIPAILLY
jgi:parallel beta-helix repeat protein